MGPLIYSWLAKSMGNNSGFQLAFEAVRRDDVGGGESLVGLSLLPVESDSISR